MEIMVFGAGYVGLVQAAGLASSGNHVVLADISRERIDLLSKGGCPIYEPGLENLLRSGAEKGYLQFVHTQDAQFEALKKKAQVYFFAVQTPEGADGLPNLDYLMKAAEMLIALPGNLSDKFVVVKSTVPVGTGDKLEAFFKERGKTPIVVSNPEFLKQGSAVPDFIKPERVVIGAENPVAFEVLGFLHRPFMMKRERIVCVSRRSAELVKYACNAFLATKISFINELSQLAEKVGANINEIREGMITDSRIGDQFLYPGVGYGGSCFPKDTHSLIAQGEKAGSRLGIVEAADQANQRQKLWAVEVLKSKLGSLSGKSIGIWGLSFKPNTDDLREAPSIPIITRLLEAGAQVVAHDPVASSRFVKENPQLKIEVVTNPYQAARGADALLILTEWQEYRTPNFADLKSSMSNPLIVDGRNIYEASFVKSQGLAYRGVGIPEA
jgi:UDPglucose 6-dehydrogenase